MPAAGTPPNLGKVTVAMYDEFDRAFRTGQLESVKAVLEEYHEQVEALRAEISEEEPRQTT